MEGTIIITELESKKEIIIKSKSELFLLEWKNEEKILTT